MLYLASESTSFPLQVLDENGELIPMVFGVDPEQGFIIQYDDWEDSENGKTYLKSMRCTRKYIKFKLINRETGEEITK